MKKLISIRLSEKADVQLDYLKARYPDKTKTRIIEESIEYNYNKERELNNECKR